MRKNSVDAPVFNAVPDSLSAILDRIFPPPPRLARAVALDDNSLRASGATEVCAALVRLPLLRSATLSNTQLKVNFP